MLQPITLVLQSAILDMQLDIKDIQPNIIYISVATEYHTLCLCNLVHRLAKKHKANILMLRIIVFIVNVAPIWNNTCIKQ